MRIAERLDHLPGALVQDQCHHSHRRSSRGRACIHPVFRCRRSRVKLSHAHLSPTASASASPAKTPWRRHRPTPHAGAKPYVCCVTRLTQLKRSLSARSLGYPRLARVPFALSAGSSVPSRSPSTLWSSMFVLLQV